MAALYQCSNDIVCICICFSHDVWSTCLSISIRWLCINLPASHHSHFVCRVQTFQPHFHGLQYHQLWHWNPPLLRIYLFFSLHLSPFVAARRKCLTPLRSVYLLAHSSTPGSLLRLPAASQVSRPESVQKRGCSWSYFHVVSCSVSPQHRLVYVLLHWKLRCCLQTESALLLATLFRSIRQYPHHWLLIILEASAVYLLVTADMLVALQVLIEKTIEMDGQAFVMFIDYSKAFDSISQAQMFEILNGLSKTPRRSTGSVLQRPVRCH